MLSFLRKKAVEKVNSALEDLKKVSDTLDRMVPKKIQATISPNLLWQLALLAALGILCGVQCLGWALVAFALTHMFLSIFENKFSKSITSVLGR